MRQIFLSHHSMDRDVAEALASLLEAVTSRTVRVWCSSIDGIQAGDRWLDSLQTALGESFAVMALLTPSSVLRPWLMYECGFGAATVPGGVIPVCMCIGESDIPAPLKSYQAYWIRDQPALAHLLETVLDKCGQTVDASAAALALEGAWSRLQPLSIRSSVSAQLLGIVGGVQSSLRIQSDHFKRAVDDKLKELQVDVELWRTGSIRIAADERGRRFLIRLYAEARNSVFSTRLSRFSGAFRESGLPEEILAAHRKARVPTTRVFVIESLEDITGRDLNEMVRQEAAGIDVRILMTISIDEAIEDFAVIDDVAVGITEFIGPQVAAGRWTFDDRPMLARYTSLRERILAKAVALEPFRQVTRTRFALWEDQVLVDVSEATVQEYQRLSKHFFGSDVAGAAQVLALRERAGGGILLLKRGAGVSAVFVGIIALVPVSTEAYRLLEVDQLKGSDFTAEHVHGRPDFRPLAYYLGAIGGMDMRAKAALVDSLQGSIRDLGRQGVESIFARPVSDDGLRLVKELRFAGPRGRKLPVKNGVCRLRLQDASTKPLQVG